MNTPPRSALIRAVELAGGQTALAASLTRITGRRYTQALVWNWLNRHPLPPEVVIPIERATDGRVTRHELRPDIYPREVA